MKKVFSCFLVLALAAMLQIGCLSSKTDSDDISSRGVPIVDLEASEVVIDILDGKTIKVNKKKINLARLSKELDRIKMKDTAKVTVKAPLSVPHSSLMAVLTELRRRGCTNIKTPKM